MKESEKKNVVTRLHKDTLLHFNYFILKGQKPNMLGTRYIQIYSLLCRWHSDLCPFKNHRRRRSPPNMSQCQMSSLKIFLKEPCVQMFKSLFFSCKALLKDAAWIYFIVIKIFSYTCDIFLFSLSLLNQDKYFRLENINTPKILVKSILEYDVVQKISLVLHVQVQ